MSNYKDLRKSPLRKSPRRKSPRHKSPRHKSPRHKSPRRRRRVGRSDIGEFDSHENTPGRNWLFEDDINPSIEECKAVIEFTKTQPQYMKAILTPINELPYPGFILHDPSVIKLDSNMRLRLMNYIDEQKSESDMNGDCKVIVSSLKHLAVLLGDSNEEYGNEVVNRLVTIFGGIVNTIILRRVKPGTDDGLCINFHTDHAQRTIQIPLNDENEYKGGKLVFLSPTEGLLKPSRLAGSATIHTNRVVHGVTPIKEGVRYSLFLLQQ